MSEIFPVWTVHRNNDDHRDGPVTDVCSSDLHANLLADRSGWYGGDAPTHQRWAIKVDGKVYLLESNTPVDLDGVVEAQRTALKKSALQKLSPEEIEVLGLNKE